MALTNAHQYAFLYEAFRVTHKRLVSLEVDDVHFEDNVQEVVFRGKSYLTLGLVVKTMPQMEHPGTRVGECNTFLIVFIIQHCVVIEGGSRVRYMCGVRPCSVRTHII